MKFKYRYLCIDCLRRITTKFQDKKAISDLSTMNACHTKYSLPAAFTVVVLALVGRRVRKRVGVFVGEGVWVGRRVGEMVGFFVRDLVGVLVGARVGLLVLVRVGRRVGWRVGIEVGVAVGVSVLQESEAVVGLSVVLEGIEPLLEVCVLGASV